LKISSSWMPNMQRRYLIAAAAAGAVALLAVGALFAQHKTAAPATAQPVAATKADTGAVQMRTVTDVYAADATIEAVRQATVSSQISGTVTQFFVDAGDRVKRGQLLARIDTRETDAQVAAQRANVAQAEAALVQAKQNFERTQSLVKQNFVSQSALDKADADLKSAQAAVEAARAGTAQAITARSFADVRSPIDGVVSRRLMEIGELAAPGRPMLDIHDPTALRAVGSVPQFVLARVTHVDKANVSLPTLNQTIAATRVTVLPAADPRLLSTQVRAELPAKLPDGVMPGTVAKILLPTGTSTKLVMPAAAVVRRSELIAAYVVGADGTPQLRQIRIGEPVEGGQIEVLAGLAAGERVQLNPLLATR
jgi:RND family efflux transporter MFP subunit